MKPLHVFGFCASFLTLPALWIAVLISYSQASPSLIFEKGFAVAAATSIRLKDGQASHRKIPVGTVVRIKNLDSGVTERAIIADNFRFFADDAQIEVSPSLALKLGIKNRCRCEIEYSTY